jgi:hypothetical protein
MIDVGSRIVNQSILIWRVFNANIEVISPYLNDLEIRNIRSQFSLISSKKEYLEIDKKLNEIAKKNNAILRKEELW